MRTGPSLTSPLVAPPHTILLAGRQVYVLERRRQLENVSGGDASIGERAVADGGDGDGDGGSRGGESGDGGAGTSGGGDAVKSVGGGDPGAGGGWQGGWQGGGELRGQITDAPIAGAAPLGWVTLARDGVPFVRVAEGTSAQPTRGGRSGGLKTGREAGGWGSPTTSRVGGSPLGAAGTGGLKSRVRLKLRSGCELWSDEVGSVPPGTLLRILERRARVPPLELSHTPENDGKAAAGLGSHAAALLHPQGGLVARARVAREGTSEPLGWVSCVDSDGASNLVPAWTAAAEEAADYLRDYRAVAMTRAMAAARQHQPVEL